MLDSNHQNMLEQIVSLHLYLQVVDLGLLHHEMWVSRTIILLQYWRSMDQLMSYASNRDAAHLPAWQHFNRSVGSDGSVGIWHETYAIQDASRHAGACETMYVNMPASLS